MVRVLAMTQIFSQKLEVCYFVIDGCFNAEIGLFHGYFLQFVSVNCMFTLISLENQLEKSINITRAAAHFYKTEKGQTFSSLVQSNPRRSKVTRLTVN